MPNLCLSAAGRLLNVSDANKRPYQPVTGVYARAETLHPLRPIRRRIYMTTVRRDGIKFAALLLSSKAACQIPALIKLLLWQMSSPTSNIGVPFFQQPHL